MGKNIPKSFRFPPDIVARLKQAAKHERLTATDTLVRLLDKHLPPLAAEKRSR